MIPASYMFKNVYQQSWEEAAVPHSEVEQTRSPDGLTTPLWSLLSAVLRRRDKPGARYFGVHVYH